jgi:hypothetical protein
MPDSEAVFSVVVGAVSDVSEVVDDPSSPAQARASVKSGARTERRARELASGPEKRRR